MIRPVTITAHDNRDRPSMTRLLRSLGLPLLLMLAGIAPAPAQSGAPFTFFAIGDAGEPGTPLQNTARAMHARATAAAQGGTPIGLLMFLGDNFYPNGLNLPPKERSAHIEEVIGPHRPLMGTLGRANVHAITGNHDYFCTAINDIPYGACTEGVIREHELPEWTFHMKYPASLRRALAEGGADSVEIFFVDSSLLLISKPEGWRPLLDSLERLLRSSAAAPGVSWRIIALHHSPFSVGDHAGYRRWDRKQQRIAYIGNCIEDGDDPFRYIQQFVSDQDNCTPRYRAYTDSLLATIERGGAKIQLMVAGHDHSLQLLNYPGRAGRFAPDVFAISGAGSKSAPVKSSTPGREFTHPQNDNRNKGKSIYGYMEGRFEGERLRLTFFDGRNGEAAEMGGAREFYLDRSGALVQTR